MYHCVSLVVHTVVHETGTGYKTIRTIVVLDAIQHVYFGCLVDVNGN